MSKRRPKQMKLFQTVFWLAYLAVFGIFYWVVLQVKLPSGVPDDFLQVMMVVLAGACATIVMIILGLVVGLFATVANR